MARPIEDILEDILRAQQAANDTLEDTAQSSKESSRVSTRLISEIQNVAGIQPNLQQPFSFISVLFENIEKQKEIFNNFQKASLGFGSTVNSLKANTQVQKNLQQFGPQIALKTAVEALETGTLGLSQKTLDLANEMNAAGEGGRQLLALQKTLISQGGLSISQMDDLAARLKESRDSYGISTDLLVESINLLADKFGEYSLMGTTEDITKAMVDLTNMYGAQNAQLLSDVIKTITTGSRLVEFTRAGVGQEVAAAQAAPTASNIMAAVNELRAAAESFYESQKGGLMPSMAAEMTKKQFGPEIFKMVQLSKAPIDQSRQVTTENVSDLLRSQESVQRDIADNSIKLNGQMAEFLAKMDSSYYLAVTQIGILLNSIVTMNRIVSAIKSFEAHVLGKATPPAGPLEKLFSLNVAATSKMGASLSRVAGGVLGIGGIFMGVKEIMDGLDSSADTQVDLMTSVLAILSTLTGLSAFFPIIGQAVGALVPLVGGLMTFLIANPIGLALLAVVGAVAGLYMLFDDDKDKGKPQKVEVVHPKEGGTVTTNSFLSANTELTRAILANAINAKRTDQMMLGELKRANELAQKTLEEAIKSGKVKPNPAGVFTFTGLGD